jgi:hypothetical protein
MRRPGTLAGSAAWCGETMTSRGLAGDWPSGTVGGRPMSNNLATRRSPQNHSPARAAQSSMNNTGSKRNSPIFVVQPTTLRVSETRRKGASGLFIWNHISRRPESRAPAPPAYGYHYTAPNREGQEKGHAVAGSSWPTLLHGSWGQQCSRLPGSRRDSAPPLCPNRAPRLIAVALPLGLRPRRHSIRPGPVPQHTPRRASSMIGKA